MSDIVIEQDYEVDEGDVGGVLNVFWCEGHGHDDGDFLRAVVEHCLEAHGSVPAIEQDTVVTEMWQWDRQRGDCVEYIRYTDPAQPPTYAIRSECHPVTVLDLDRRGRGAPRCSVRGCRSSFRIGTSVQAVSAADLDESKPPVLIQVYLCPTHQGAIPEPHYRVVMVPVGAEIVLPKPDEATS